jgi:5-methyltetrahydrofolate--homocysteine methyltransferase
VEGDIHDIAKDIVEFMLEVNGFEVIDLGVDVPAAKFVEAVKQSGATVVGLSGFLTLAYDPMKNTVQALKDAGLRDKVKIMIGGGQMDDQVAAYAKADAYGKDAMAAVTLAKGWVGAK